MGIKIFGKEIDFLDENNAITAAVITITAIILAPPTGGASLAWAGKVFAVTLAAGATLKGLLSEDIDLNANKGYLITQRGAALDHQIIYGKVRVGGALVYEASSGTDNKFLHRVIAFSGHEIESFEGIYFNDELITLSGNNVTSPSRFNGKIKIETRLGTDTQTAVTNLSPPSEWDSDCKLLGISYIYIRYEYDQDAFADGIPNVTALIKGKKVYDPRTSSTAWSSNPALCLRDYLTSSYGLAENAYNIDDTVISTAANVCDQMSEKSTFITAGSFVVGNEYKIKSGTGFTSIGAADNNVGTIFTATGVGTGSGTAYDRRYTLNGAFTTSITPSDILQDLTSTMGGLLWYSQGKWRMKPAYYTAPVINLTDDDLRSGFSVSTRHSRRDNFNVVKGTYRGPETSYQITDYPQVTNVTQAGALVVGSPYTITDLGNTNWNTAAGTSGVTYAKGNTFTAAAVGSGTGKADAFLGADNGQESIADLELPFTNSFSEARRLGLISLERNRQQLQVQASFGMRAFEVQVGDVVTITNSRFGWTNKTFEVLTWNFGLAGELELAVTMTLKEISSSVFDETDDGAVLELDNTTLASAFDIQTPTLATPATSAEINEDGTSVPTIVFTWSVTTDDLIAQYEFQWKKSTDTEYNSSVLLGKEFTLFPVISGVTYDYRVRAFNFLGVRSAFASGSIAATKDATAPDPPSAPTVTAGVKQLTISWDNYTKPADFAFMQVFEEVSGSVYQRGTSAGTSFAHTGLTQNTTHTYKIKAVDFSGNDSAVSLTANGTVLADTQGATGVPVMTSNAYYLSTTDTTPNQNGRIYFGASLSDQSTQASDGPFPSTIYIRLDEDGLALASNSSSLINLDTDLTQAVSTGGSGLLIYENDQNWGWYTPSGNAGGFSTSGGYYFMEGTLQSSEGNIDVTGKWYRIGVGKKGPQGPSGLIVTLNGADIPMNNQTGEPPVETGVDPRPNNSTTQAKLDEAFLALNPLLSQMSEVTEDAIVWGRFILTKEQTFTTTASQLTFTLSGGHTPDKYTRIIYDSEQLISGDFTSASPDAVTGDSTSITLTNQFLSRKGLTSVPSGKTVEIYYIQASARKWDYTSQDWTDNSAIFDVPVIFSPLVLSKEVLTQALAANEITADQLVINKDVDLLDGAAWRIGKSDYSSNVDGIFFGNPSGSGATNYGFAFTATSNSGTANEHGLEITPQHTKLIQPIITKQATGTVSISDKQTTQTITIKNSSTNPNAQTVTINAIGGGGGGAGAESQSGSAGAGGNTTYTLTITGGPEAGSYPVTASGGAAGTGYGAAKTDGDRGEDSSRATGGYGGGAYGVGGTGTLGSGGGGGGGRDYNWSTSSRKGGGGGGAGSRASNSYDISAATSVSLNITAIGAGGAGMSSNRGNGGAGGTGVLYGSIQTEGLDPVVLNTDAEYKSGTVGRFQSWQSITVTQNVWVANPDDQPVQVCISQGVAGGGSSYFQIADDANGTNSIDITQKSDDNARELMAACIVPVGKYFRQTNHGSYLAAILRT
jgi:hypothetical protein